MMLDKIFSTDLLWNENFWLPPNTTWANLNDIKIAIARYEDLWLSYPLAIVFLIVRWMCNRWIFSPFAIAMGVKNSSSNFVANFHFLLICCLYQIWLLSLNKSGKPSIPLPFICCLFQFGFGQSTIWQI